MAVEYRPVLEAEIPETVDLFLASLVDMYARMGLNAPPPPRDGREVRLMIPGVNHDALRFAFASGLRLAGYSHLLTSAPFGRMEQYLSSGPSLF